MNVGMMAKWAGGAGRAGRAGRAGMHACGWVGTHGQTQRWWEVMELGRKG